MYTLNDWIFYDIKVSNDFTNIQGIENIFLIKEDFFGWKPCIIYKNSFWMSYTYTCESNDSNFRHSLGIYDYNSLTYNYLKKLKDMEDSSFFVKVDSIKIPDINNRLFFSNYSLKEKKIKKKSVLLGQYLGNNCCANGFNRMGVREGEINVKKVYLSSDKKIIYFVQDSKTYLAYEINATENNFDISNYGCSKNFKDNLDSYTDCKNILLLPSSNLIELKVEEHHDDLELLIIPKNFQKEKKIISLLIQDQENFKIPENFKLENKNVFKYFAIPLYLIIIPIDLIIFPIRILSVGALAPSRD